MISEIFLQVLKVSFFTSILIGVLLLLVPFFKKRYSAKWRYIVWLVIAIRLLIPFGISLPQAPLKIEIPEQIESVASAVNYNQTGVALDDYSSNNQAWIDNNNASQYLNNTELAPKPESGTTLASFTLMDIAGFIWLAGVIVFLLFQFISYRIFLHSMKQSQIEAVPDNIKEILFQLGKSMGLNKLPEPLITYVVSAPVLVGLFRPRILLPHSKYENEELSFIIRHELVHYQRRDMTYKFVLTLANALHWFNPIVYIMASQAARDIELVCDDNVIRELNDELRASYGNTILSTLPKNRRLETMFSTHFGSNKKNIKDRLRNLFDTTVKHRGTLALCAIVICTIIITSFVTLSYAADYASLKEIVHPPVTIQEEKNTTLLSYTKGVQSPSYDKIPIKVNQTGTKIVLQVEATGESIRKIQLLSPDGKTNRSYHINGNGVQSGNQEYLTYSNMLHLVSSAAETGTWTLYVESPKAGDVISISAQLIDQNKYTFVTETTENIKETVAATAPVSKSTPIKKDSIYDYYRTYSEAKNDIESGYIFYMDKSFNIQAMPTVTGGSNHFTVHKDNKLNIEISMKNLINNNGSSLDIFAPASRIRFELISPTGEIVYSFLRSGKDLEKAQTVTDTVTLTPGEWKYNIEFAYLTNGVDVSNLKIAAWYDKIYQEDITWLLDHKLNGTKSEASSAETTVSEQKPLQNMTVRAVAYDGTWAAASSIEGNTWQAQIDDEIKWIADTYEENKTSFTITEALPIKEASNISRINYLYSNSNIFQDMSRMNNGIYIVEDGRFFTDSGFTLTSDTIHRTVVMADNSSDIYLDIDYNLKTGKTAVWLIDPDGKIVYQGGLNTAYKGTRTVSGKNGLWSIVRVFQGNDKGSVSGNISLTLRQNSIPQTSSISSKDTAALSIEKGQTYFQIVSKNGKNVANSGSFFASTGQKLTITAESSIKGGTVDLFLFSPSSEEQRFTFDGSNKTVTVELTSGPWAYNCTGFFESGNIVITGVFDGNVYENTNYINDQILNSGTEKYDNEAIRRMNASGTWGNYINELLPNMSSAAVEAVVDIYLDRHLFDNITTPESAQHVAETIAPALKHMTKAARKSAEKRIEAYY